MNRAGFVGTAPQESCYSYLPSLPRCLLREYAMLPSVSKRRASRLAGRGGGEESALRDSSSCGVSRITEILTYGGSN